MKRSEMIDLMVNHWNGAQNLGSLGAMMNYVLVRMEEKGMRPPLIAQVIETGEIMPFDDMPRGTSCKFMESWEPEDV